MIPTLPNARHAFNPLSKQTEKKNVPFLSNQIHKYDIYNSFWVFF